MKKEITTEAKTVEEAVAIGAEALGTDVSAVTYDVTREPKKGLFGIGAQTAVVHVTYVPTPEDAAVDFLKTLLADMELNATVEMKDDADGDKLIAVDGENVGVLIGHHGDTLDALQYLVNLAANRREDDEEDRSYRKFSVDVENYRAKREETLRELARRMAAKVQKSGKSMALEPMNPYERRIIHSEVQNIEGVCTYSVGYDNNRRIVIAPQGGDGTGNKDGAPAQKKPYTKQPRTQSRPNPAKNSGTADGEAAQQPQTRKPYPPRDRQNQNRPPRYTKPTGAEQTAADAKPVSGEADEEIQSGNGIRKMKQPYYMRPKNGGYPSKRPNANGNPANKPQKEAVSAEQSSAAEAADAAEAAATYEKTERTYQKPVKKASVESYFSALENERSGKKEKEEPSDIAKACGIYDDDTSESNPTEN